MMHWTILTTLMLAIPTQTPGELGLLRGEIYQRWSLRALTRVPEQDDWVTFKPTKARTLVTFHRDGRCVVLSLDAERRYSYEITDESILLKDENVLHTWVILDIFYIQDEKVGPRLTGVLMFAPEWGEFLLSNTETPIRLPKPVLESIGQRAAERTRKEGRRLMEDSDPASAVAWLRKSLEYEPVATTCELIAESYDALEDCTAAARWREKASAIIQQVTKESNGE